MFFTQLKDFPLSFGAEFAVAFAKLVYLVVYAQESFLADVQAHQNFREIMFVGFQGLLGASYVLLEYALAVYEPVLFIKLIYVVCHRPSIVTLEFREAETLREEVVHGVIGPPGQVLKTGCQACFGSE